MKKWMMWLMSLVIVSAAVLSGADYLSPLQKNTRSLKKQMMNNTRSEGFLIDFIDFDFDMLIVFDESMSRKQMEEKLGFQSHHLREGDPGMHNMVFVKGKEAVAYLHGYELFSLELDSGIYLKSEIESMIYHQKEKRYTFEK
ncbi:MAG: hypothetical protein IJC38_02030 [Erysipelotrichaceae bacterium]|nr:hypothetical protein [Erysipelotrichaceae bacterium]